MDLAAASAGGTIGIVGTLAALEMKKKDVKEKAECPYCTSSGHLTCAVCLGGGTLLSGQGSQFCGNCEGSGCGQNFPFSFNFSNIMNVILLKNCENRFVTCVNCKGDGRLVPTMLDSSVSRDPESELEDIGMA